MPARRSRSRRRSRKAPRDWFIERVPSDARLTHELGRWKKMRDEGWDLTVLVAPDRKSVVAFGLLP